MHDVDVVVIGAGAAGVGAGQALRARGLSFTILEAGDRVGGRAFTDTASLPVAWDQGCHWMHCADVNPLVAEADRVGTTYLRQLREGAYRYWWRGGWLAGDDLAAAVQVPRLLEVAEVLVCLELLTLAAVAVAVHLAADRLMVATVALAWLLSNTQIATPLQSVQG
jgi:monoamine oxidase